jgi:hypothetical protein
MHRNIMHGKVYKANKGIAQSVLPISSIQSSIYEQEDSRNSKHCNLLLLEIPPILLIYQYQIQIIPRRELLINIPEGRCQFESPQE